VQIYEAVMRDQSGVPTTGLLKGIGYLKDNRLLPRGFDKRTADPDVAVYGEAAGDDDFAAAGDRVRYVVRLGPANGPFQIEAVLRYQPIAFRWAENLATYDAAEPRRFVQYYRSMSAASSTWLARAVATVR
jgi:hypothetical protein